MGEALTKKIDIFAISTDPIYIGTGGYTIGRVDNTIVRDPITNIPKIPGSSLAGTWRYYMALKLISEIKDKKPDFNSTEYESHGNLKEKFERYKWKNEPEEDGKKWEYWKYNKIARITCAGQDESPNIEINETPSSKTGHCGHCIVCKAFGFSKKDISSQGMLFFSDLHILFFPVYTRFGTKWITSKRILIENGLLENGESKENNEEKAIVLENPSENNKYINLGWLNLPYEVRSINIQTDKIKNLYELSGKDIVIVPDQLLSHIINSNLEVRTSVSIDPITGAAKEGALFTSEAIPRGTIFSGNIRIFKRLNDDTLPEIKLVCEALEDSKHFFETLGIGGMTTRGFGRLKMGSLNCKENENPASGGENGES